MNNVEQPKDEVKWVIYNDYQKINSKITQVILSLEARACNGYLLIQLIDSIMIEVLYENMDEFLNQYSSAFSQDCIGAILSSINDKKDNLIVESGQYKYVGDKYHGLRHKNKYAHLYSDPTIPLNDTLSIDLSKTQNFVLNAWYNDPNNFEKIIDTAQIIIENYPNSRFYILGNSMSWVGKAMELILEHEHLQNTVKYIPMSGNFTLSLLLLQDEYINIWYEKCKEVQYEEKYYNYLETIGLDIGNIIKNFVNNAQKTIIVELIENGKGLSSFLSILYEWAVREDKLDLLYKSLEVVTFSYQDTFMNGRQSLSLLGKYETAEIKLNDYSIDWTELIDLLDYDNHMSLNDCKSARFVPYYPPEKWNEPPT